MEKGQYSADTGSTRVCTEDNIHVIPYSEGYSLSRQSTVRLNASGKYRIRSRFDLCIFSR